MILRKLRRLGEASLQLNPGLVSRTTLPCQCTLMALGRFYLSFKNLKKNTFKKSREKTLDKNAHSEIGCLLSIFLKNYIKKKYKEKNVQLWITMH